MTEDAYRTSRAGDLVYEYGHEELQNTPHRASRQLLITRIPPHHPTEVNCPRTSDNHPH
jgi:hypothetical protein